MTQNDFLQQLVQHIGTQHVLTSSEEMAPFSLDRRGRYQGKPLAVALPNTRADMAQIIKLAAYYHVAIVPQGGNTSTCGAATPDSSGQQVIVGTRALNRLIEIDVHNNTMTLEAGVTLKQAQDYAAAQQRLFPLSLASEESCQIGGNLSTNAGGLTVLRYGTMRELTLGLEVILPDGQVLNALTGLRKDTTGLDIKQLFIGAEGQLGLITAATLKLFPHPTAHATALIGVSDLTLAISWFNNLQAAFGSRVTTFELMSQPCLQLVSKLQTANVPFNAPWTLLLELSDSGSSQKLSENLTRWCGYQQHTVASVIAKNSEERASMWRLREVLPDTQRLLGPSIKHDIALPTSSIPTFIERANTTLQRAFPHCLTLIFGHIGDGNLHYNVSFTRPGNADLFDDEYRVNEIIYDLVYALGGTLAAEHGIGQLKSHWLEHYKDPASLNLMRRIKGLLDPHNLMNPGKWLSLT